jgi:predicted nucleotidyltransferase
VFELVLTPAERALLNALNTLGVRYLIVGMGAALIEGAPGTTQDLDLWFGRIDPERLQQAARRAGGFYTSGFGLQPPALGGEGLDRVDVVVGAAGLESFDREFAGAREYDLDGVRVKVLPLERVIVSKRAANRPKDAAQLPMLDATMAARRARGEDEENP